MAVRRLRRRDFFATLTSLAAAPPRALALSPFPVHFRKPSPYQDVLAYVEPGKDGFPGEKTAAEIEARLRDLLAVRDLPLAPDFRGTSPLPIRYRTVAEGVDAAEFGANRPFREGLAGWIDALGRVRRAAFYVLPGDLVRYEIAAGSTYRVGTWRQVWREGRLTEFQPISETVTRAERPFFEDITGHCFRGVDSFAQQLLRGNPWWRSRLDPATGLDVYGGNGLAVGDIDNDGWDEIYICQPGGLPNRLYKNLGGGRLADITEKAGVGILDDTPSALFVDLRNSGRQDLVVLRSTGPLLFFGRGDGTFTHVPGAFRFRTPAQGSFTGMAAADYDRDGRVDLYLCCYVYFQSEDQYRYPLPYHDARNGPPNFLFRNRLTETGGYFEDVTEQTGLNHNNDRYSFAAAWCDFDGDGWPDLYVANDFGRSNLYRNRGGRFQDEAAAAGVENMAPGMSAAWFDYDGDGRPDLYVSNMWTAAGQRVAAGAAFAPGRELRREYRSHTRGNSLYRNRGDGAFQETSGAEGVEMGRWAWSADAFDWDNDGSPEILVTTGMLTNASEKDLDSFFWRQVVAKSPITAKPAPDYENGWNAINQLIREDYSWCGREPNVYYRRVQPADGSPPRFYDFSGVSGLDFAEDSRAFAVTDIDGDGNLDIILKSRLAPQVRVLRNQCGVGRQALAIRLRGANSNRDAIGARVEVNGRIQFLSAGSGYLSQHSKQLHFGLGGADEAEVRVIWPSGLRQEFGRLQPGFRYDLAEGSPEVRRTPFRARARIAPGEVGKPENQPSWAPAWLLDPVPLPVTHRGPGFVLLTAGDRPALPAGLPGEVVDLSRSSPDLAAHYAIFRRYLFELRTDLELPLLLLIDGQSRVHRFYPNVPPPETLREDLRLLERGRSRELAVPFPGVWHGQPRRSYFKLGAAFYWSGYPDQAIPYLDEVVRRRPDNWKALLALGQIHYDAGRWESALDAYEKALAAKDNAVAALLGAGRSCAELGDLRRAEARLRRAVELDPQSSDAANQLGLVLAKAGRGAEAKQWFQRAIALDRTHTGAINNLAVLYVKLGQPQDAIAAFQYGIGVAPDDGTLYLNLGRLYVSLGEREKAREVMRSLLARKPGDPAAARALAELEAR